MNSKRDYDYEPQPNSVWIAVSTEHEPPLLLGTYLGTIEDTIYYFDSGPDETEHSAPSDCVRLVKIPPRG